MIRRFHRFLLDRMVLRPSREPLEAGEQHAMESRIRVGRDEETIAWFVHGDLSNCRTLVLKFPGTAGRAERSTPFPANLIGSENGEGDGHREVTIATWNPPGYGRSTGTAKLSRMADAASAWAIDVLGRCDGKPQIVLCGNSLGCCVAAAVAAEESVSAATKWMMLRNPPPLRQVVPAVANRYPLGRWIRPVVDALPVSMDLEATLPAVRCPVIVVTSGDDRLVDPAMQSRLLAKHAGRNVQVVMEGLDHHDPPGPEHRKAISAAILQIQPGTRSKMTEATCR